MKKLDPAAYVNFTTVDVAIGFYNNVIPDGYEAVYPGSYVDDLIRERNNAEKREYDALGRIAELEKQLNDRA